MLSMSPDLELDVSKVCAAIEAERVRRGLTRYRVAQELGVSYGTMRYWERGRSGMNADVAVRIFTWLGLDRDLRAFAPAARRPAARPQDGGGLERARAGASARHRPDSSTPRRS